jgi:predicted dehydrogenase
MKTYRVAIIGLGGMGTHHAEAVQALPGCELVGGAEIDPDRTRKWQDQFGVRAVFQNYEDMLIEVNPDIAIVATQAPLHHAPTLSAARRGIHVFCEKPIALTLGQADEMVRICDENGVKFAINHIKRGSPYNQHVLDRIAAGEIGQVVRIRAFDKGGRKAGNSLMEMGTHLYDWIRLFAGDVDWCHAHLTQLDGRESTVDDIKPTQEVDPKDRDAGLVLGERGFVSFRFRNGIHAEVNFLAQPETNDQGYGIDLIGTEGRIALRESVGTSMFIHRGQHHTPDEPWGRVDLPEEDIDETGNERDKLSRRFLLQKLMLKDLIAAIEEDRDPLASGRNGRDCLEMIHLTWESHLQKKRVNAPLELRDHLLERWRNDHS